MRRIAKFFGTSKQRTGAMLSLVGLASAYCGHHGNNNASKDCDTAHNAPNRRTPITLAMESLGISPTRESLAPVRCFDVPKNLAMPRKFNALVIDLNQRRHAQTIGFLYARSFSRKGTMDARAK